MTLYVPDADVLAHAFRTDAPHHQECARWLNDALTTDRIGLADSILSEFARIVTHPRIFAEPASAAAALGFVRNLIDAPRSEWLRQGATTWESLERVAEADAGVRGNLIRDAVVAALCIANGATLVTRDRGFARFPGLKRAEVG